MKPLCSNTGFLFGCLISAASASCGGKDHTVTGPAPVVSVTVSPASANVNEFDSLQLTATPRDAQGNPLTGRPVTWSTNAGTKASVSQTGIVRALQGGVVTVIGTSEGISGSASITIRVPVTVVTLSPDTATLYSGDTLRLATALLGPSGDPPTDSALSWTSADTTTATVTSGLVTARRAGSVVVKATASDGKFATASISVRLRVAVVLVTPDTGHVVVPATLNLHADLRDSTGSPLTGRIINWTVSDTTFATLQTNSGTDVALLGRGSGSVTVHAVSETKIGVGTYTIIRPSVSTVVVVPDTATLVVDDIGNDRPTAVQLTGTAHDSVGSPLPDRLIHWRLLDTALAALSDSTGPTTVVTGRASGTARVVGSAEGSADTAFVRLVLPSVASVVASPDTASFVFPSTDTLYAVARDSIGHLLLRPIHWAVQDTTIAGSSDTTGGLIIITGRHTGQTIAIASCQGHADTVVVRVVRVAVAGVRLGPDTSHVLIHAVRPAFYGYAVDSANNILLGRTIVWSSSDSSVALADSQGTSGGYSYAHVLGVSLGTAIITATSEGVSGTWHATVYAVHYNAVSVQVLRGCALASDDTTTFCWAFTSTVYPVPASPHLTLISAGNNHICGIAVSGAGVCWGGDEFGQLGDAQPQLETDSAHLVLGGNLFQTISAGYHHTCGVTQTGTGLCWGEDSTGQLGTGDNTQRSTPAPVAGGLTFSSISAGNGFSCGITTSQTAYCWGANANGQLGTAGTGGANTPQSVVGGHLFSRISAGATHACGIDTTGGAYCWGANSVGQLGIGTTIDHSSPVAVAGGLTFQSISAGNGFTCGVSTLGSAYCWGVNDSYQLGNGTQNGSTIPTPVSGNLSLQSISAGWTAACAVGPSGAYCWGIGPLGSFNGAAQTPSPIWGVP